MELGKGLVGFEPEALDLLQNYSWPYNISQFKRILHETALVTEGSYVTADMVFKSLSKEPGHTLGAVPNSSGTGSRNYNPQKTLEQMNREIVLAALSSNNGNQTRTAKQLGISRSTLWRYLNGK